MNPNNSSQSQQTESQQVILKVDRVVQDGDRVRLNLSLQNNQAQAVEFLYSFLDVRDQDDNLLSSLTESLPQTLPPDGKIYQGTVEILGPLSDTISSVSLRLASYPDEKVKLQVTGIALPKS